MDTGSRKLAIAIDVEDREACLSTAYAFQGLPVVLKLGLGLLPLLEPGDIKFLRDEGFELFIDVKLHDIPSQVARAVSAWAGLGVKYLTVHASGGAKMLSEASNAAKDTGLRLLGVTVLTSLGSYDLQLLGMSSIVEDQVSRLVEIGVRSEISGFVCSVGEIAKVREIAGLESFVVTPGLVTERTQSHPDQARVYTIEEAVERGSNMLVVGRSILKSAEPRLAAEAVLKVLHG
jgi:orotidine-5'-phosphate decarboxylase